MADKRTIEAERKHAVRELTVLSLLIWFVLQHELGRASFAYGVRAVCLRLIVLIAAYILQKHCRPEHGAGILNTPRDAFSFRTGRCDTTFLDNSGFRDFIRETVTGQACDSKRGLMQP